MHGPLLSSGLDHLRTCDRVVIVFQEYICIFAWFTQAKDIGRFAGDPKLASLSGVVAFACFFYVFRSAGKWSSNCSMPV